MSANRKNGKEGGMSRLFRRRNVKEDNVHDGGIPLEIPSTSLITSMKEESRWRPSLEKAKTERQFTSKNFRGLSPTTKRRMELALGIGNHSVTSAPTILNYEDNISSTHSAPIIHNTSDRKYIPSKSSKRHSIEFDSCKTANQSSRSLGLRRPMEFDSRKTVNQSSRSLGLLGLSSPPSTRKIRFHSTVEASQKSGGQTAATPSIATALLVSERKTEKLKANVKIPQGKVSIVITDIQGSTMMWEQDPSAMKDALDVHDAIVRKCYVKQSGYEITTEGDSFHLAFHHPLDALSFCLDCQTKLFNAPWSDDILALDNARDDRERKMRGLRVRMGVHHGHTASATHEITHRTFFKGEGIDIAKALEKGAHGGQILTNVETWKAVSGMGERYLGSPQILDLGKHELGEANKKTQRLLQLVPKQLAFNYCAFRGTRQLSHNERPEGRTFPPPKTYMQLSTGFFDAPYVDNKVTIVFINTVTTRELDEKKMTEHSHKLANLIRNLLIRSKPPGYECQEDNGTWMLAFHCVGSSIMFGLNLIDKLNSSNSPLLAKVGVHSGIYASMGPHTITGRADYFGPVVNRAARIAANSNTGEVRLGIPKPGLKNFQPPKVKEVEVRYLGTELFKGVNVEMCLFACIPFSVKDEDGKKVPRRMSLIRETAKST